uniref:ROK family protein n=1 Tax=Phenylobacterium glaciei TaxID=2803784 RepID=A0A974P5Z0_9CAUL|nr:ROK family protein [Phenylobacterium glaciei]
MLETDVSAAALAEQAAGAGAGLDTVAYVTVGTGIGGGLAIDGRPLKGALHPEVGHLRVHRHPGDTTPCVCPFHDDCAEGMAAGPAIAARLAPGEILQGRPEVQAMVADYLGQLCASLVLAWSPRCIVMGGGLLTTRVCWVRWGRAAAAPGTLCRPGRRTGGLPAPAGLHRLRPGGRDDPGAAGGGEG